MKTKNMKKINTKEIVKDVITDLNREITILTEEIEGANSHIEYQDELIQELVDSLDSISEYLDDTRRELDRQYDKLMLVRYICTGAIITMITVAIGNLLA
jgi:predicted  nucleic acid-binding Zn-ribbon protein